MDAVARYFQGFTKDQPHPPMPATGTEGRCELCGGPRDAPLHVQYTACHQDQSASILMVD